MDPLAILLAVLCVAAVVRALYSDRDRVERTIERPF